MLVMQGIIFLVILFSETLFGRFSKLAETGGSVMEARLVGVLIAVLGERFGSAPHFFLSRSANA